MINSNIIMAWQELCAAEQECFGDSLTLSTVEPILQRLLLAEAERLALEWRKTHAHGVVVREG